MIGQKIEIYRANGRYERCAVLYWPTDMKECDYIVVQDSNGQEIICRQGNGAWLEMSSMHIIMRLRIGNAKRAEADHASDMEAAALP